MTAEEEAKSNHEYGKVVAAQYKQAFLDGKLKVNTCGHNHTDFERAKREIEKGWGAYARLFDGGIYFTLFGKCLAEKLKDPNWHHPTHDEEWWDFAEDFECHKCGKRLEWRTNGVEVRAFTTEYKRNERGFPTDVSYHDNPCLYANGMPEAVVHVLDVPSGKLVMGNDLRDFFPDEVVFKEEKHDSINHFAGKVEFMQDYAKAGMLTGFCGDGGADVYVNADHTSIILGHAHTDEDGNDITGTIILDGMEHKPVAHISFQLWWYGAADYKVCWNQNKVAAKKQIKKLEWRNRSYPKSFIHDELFYINVLPGTYEMRHYAHNIDVHDSSVGDCIISRIVKV